MDIYVIMREDYIGLHEDGSGIFEIERIYQELNDAIEYLADKLEPLIYELYDCKNRAEVTEIIGDKMFNDDEQIGIYKCEIHELY